MKHLLPICFLTVVLFMTGCATQQAPFLVRQSSEMATVVALQKLDASAQDAENLETIAVTVQDVLDGDGKVDTAKLKLLVREKIVETFDEQKYKVSLTVLVNNVTNIIVHQITSNPDLIDPETYVVVLIRAAAEGIESGAVLYKSTL